MKKIVIALLLMFLFSCNLFNQAPDLKKAKDAEIVGKYSDAYAIYMAALFKMTSLINIPDVNRSKFMDASKWKKELENYIIKLNENKIKNRNTFVAILSSINNCYPNIQNFNKILDMRSIVLQPEMYRKEWNRVFFAVNIKPDPAIATLADDNYKKNISIIAISSPQSYSYEINLINTVTGTRTVASLYPESSVRFAAVPGEYILALQSRIVFPNGAKWISTHTRIPLSVPQQASFISGSIQTSVNRAN